MTTKAKLTDQCLWLKHIEDGALKDAMRSLHPGSIISLYVDGIPLDFQRMATGSDGRITHGFNPVGEGAKVWRARYQDGRHFDIELTFRPVSND